MGALLPSGNVPTNSGAVSYLPIQPLDGVVGADPPPVFHWEARARQRLGVTLAHERDLGIPGDD